LLFQIGIGFILLLLLTKKILDKTQQLRYCSNARNETRNKQLPVADAKQERKLWKAVRGRILWEAQLLSKEWRKNARPVPRVWSRGFV